MSVKIGINPSVWILEGVPELSDLIPIDRCLKEARQAGYLGIEMSGSFPRDVRQLTPILDRHGIALVSGWYEGSIIAHDAEEEFDAVLPFLRFLKDMGCSRVVYADATGNSFSDAAAPLSARPTLPHDQWPAYGRKMTALAERMRDFGVAMAFHHHIGTVVETDQDVDRLMAETGPAVGLLLDTGHSVLAGGDPVALATRHASRVNHVHCKDVRRQQHRQALAQNQSFISAVLAGVFTVPGDGFIDYAPILSVLKQADYQGWLVVEAEQDPRLADPLHYAELGHRNLHRLARDAGFHVAQSL